MCEFLNGKLLWAHQHIFIYQLQRSLPLWLFEAAGDGHALAEPDCVRVGKPRLTKTLFYFSAGTLSKRSLAKGIWSGLKKRRTFSFFVCLSPLYLSFSLFQPVGYAKLYMLGNTDPVVSWGSKGPGFEFHKKRGRGSISRNTMPQLESSMALTLKAASACKYHRIIL